MRGERLRDGRREAVAIDRQARRRREPGWRRRRRITREPSRRISSCSRPTALVSRSSERNELEHTSSARPSVRCASVARARPHFMQHDRNARRGDLPCGFRTGQSAADDMDGLLLRLASWTIPRPMEAARQWPRGGEGAGVVSHRFAIAGGAARGSDAGRGCGPSSSRRRWSSFIRRSRWSRRAPTQMTVCYGFVCRLRLRSRLHGRASARRSRT